MPRENKRASEEATSPSPFANTHWSLVISAGSDSSPDAKLALSALCETYWSPLYGYVRRRVSDPNEAQDLTQAFFCELLEKNVLASATPERGRFRAFLLTALKHFLSKEWEKRRAQKRGGGRPPISLDFATAESSLRIEPASGLTPEQIYDPRWAMTLLDETLRQLQREFERAGRLAMFDELKPFLIGSVALTTYAEVAARLDMTEAAARKAGSRMRQRYGELLRGEIAKTVGDPEEVNDEIRKLFATLKL